MIQMPAPARLLLLCMSLATIPLIAETHRDVEYARVGDTSLRMDYFVPEGAGRFPQ